MAIGIGAAILGGALIGGVSSAFGAKSQNKAAQAATREQMAFQKESAQHSYRWAMDDMRKAGLNPMLAYKQGGSGTLGGSSYTPANVGAAAATGATGGATTALSAKRFQIEKLRSIADIDNTYVDTKLKSDQADLTYQQRLNAMTMGKSLLEDLQIKRAEASSARAAEEFYNSPTGKALRKYELGARSIVPFFTPFKKR